jgi:hypothetical protein
LHKLPHPLGASVNRKFKPEFNEPVRGTAGGSGTLAAGGGGRSNGGEQQQQVNKILNKKNSNFNKLFFSATSTNLTNSIRTTKTIKISKTSKIS